MTKEEEQLLKEVHGDLYEDLVRVYHIRTVCEVLREIYWGTKDQDIRDRVKEAMLLSKKITSRLTYYWKQANPDKADPTHDNLYQPNPFSKEAKEERLKQALEELEE